MPLIYLPETIGAGRGFETIPPMWNCCHVLATAGIKPAAWLFYSVPTLIQQEQSNKSTT